MSGRRTECLLQNEPFIYLPNINTLDTDLACWLFVDFSLLSTVSIECFFNSCVSWGGKTAEEMVTRFETIQPEKYDPIPQRQQNRPKETTPYKAGIANSTKWNIVKQTKSMPINRAFLLLDIWALSPNLATFHNTLIEQSMRLVSIILDCSS